MPAARDRGARDRQEEQVKTVTEGPHRLAGGARQWVSREPRRAIRYGHEKHSNQAERVFERTGLKGAPCVMKDTELEKLLNVISLRERVSREPRGGLQ